MVESRHLLFVLTIVGLSLVYVSTTAAQVAMPREGRQFLTVGIDASASQLNYTDRNRVEYTRGGHIRLGLQQQINRFFFMTLSGGVGAVSIDEYEFVEGQAQSDSIRPDWDISVEGRWLPFGEYGGWFTGLGLSWSMFDGDEASLHTFGPRARIGRYLWPNTEEFFCISGSYTYPAISGVAVPQQFGQQSPDVRSVRAHRIGLLLTYGF